jgi:hypothetical protein
MDQTIRKHTNQEIAFSCVARMGHFMPLVPYMKGLADKGHQVTLFCHNDPSQSQRGEQWGGAAERLREFGLSNVQLVPLKLPDHGNCV